MTKKQKKKSTLTVILIVFMLVGLSLLLYPTISNYYNQFHQSRAINKYAERVDSMSKEEYDTVWESARAYNRELVSKENRYLLDAESRERYNRELNVAEDGVMGYIEIPKISVSLPVYHGTSTAVLQVAVGHLEWTSLPTGGEGTHSVFSGHRGLPSATLFTQLDRMEEGDLFFLRVLDETLTYQVDQIKVVEPEETEDLTVVEGEDYCTLVTCTPYGINSHRLLVRGHRVETPEDAIVTTVVSDATRIDPLVVVPILAILLLVAVLIALSVWDARKKKIRKIVEEQKTKPILSAEETKGTDREETD